MRPVFLSMTAFGPFPETEEIVFDQLGSHPLFLINGPTGSGKTTILDAVCFALYGKSTGDEREAAQMRCDFSLPGTLTEVTLVFELAGKTYRIHRLPEQQRPKSRGEGFTNQPAKADLSEVLADGSETVMVTKSVKEVGTRIETLTGLNVDQFRQVMVLPQGKFRELLMAESKDREQIFSKLFQTQVYKKLEDRLKLQAKEVRQEVEKQKQIFQGILESVELDSLENLSLEQNTLSPKWGQAKKLRMEKDKRFLEVSAKLQKANALDEQFRRLETIRKQHDQLVGKKSESDKKRLQAQMAESALKLSPVHKEMLRCRAELTTSEKKLQQADKARLSAQKTLKAAEQKMETVEPLTRQLDLLKQEQAKLESFQERAVVLKKARNTLARAEKKEKEASAQLQQANDSLSHLLKEKELTEKSMEELRRQLAALTDKKLEFKELAEFLSKKEELEKRRKKQSRLQTTLEKAELRGKELGNQHETAERRLRTLEMEWHRGQAAILAGELEAGNPCPVCGSREHPTPAVGSDSIPTEPELEQARKQQQESDKVLKKAREEFVSLRSELKGLTDDINATMEKMGPSAETSLGALKSQYKSLETDIKILQNQQKQLDKSAETLSKIKEKETEAQKAIEAARKHHTEEQSLAAGAKAQFASAQQELPEEFRSQGVLDKSIKEKSASVKKLEKELNGIRKQHQECSGQLKAAEASHKAMTESHTSAEKNAGEAAASWASALKQSRFESESAYEAALLEEKPLQKLKKEIEEFDSQLNQVKGALDQQEAALKDVKKPDLESVQTDLRKADKEKTEAEKEWLQLDKRLSQLQDTRKKLEKTEQERKKLDQEYAVVGTLSDVAGGQTGNKISLQRFVLSVLLDDVLLEASHRLKMMSKGRYQLLRKESRTKGNRASGLDLEVEDAYSGKVRPVATLSGGESFMAALSLALGLSDVVQAYAGGIRLDTLFIDEGFGSLDPEALDLAIRTLVDLQSSGRMIGIISHVADLQEQLSIRIDVIAGRTGSHIKLVAP